MIQKILVANRGEIAVRIIRACKELGIPTVAVFSEVDRGALHTQLADEAVCIGPASSADSYLDMHAILATCEMTGANAVHPGFGFLSENSQFVRLCERVGIIFIGPSSEVIARMGDKAEAKQTMCEAKVPVIPGSDGIVKDVKQAVKEAKKIGFPLLIKASAGGGGRGIRVVNEEAELETQFAAASAEALTSFGDAGIYMERFLENPRHIEVQILADSHGNVLHLGERDCSMQRRNQKVLEESPSPASVMTPRLRKRMGEVAKRAAKHVGYENAGTIEFLVDRRGEFYFMEMNTRIQVEHPVTEEVTGIDLVKSQIRIANGIALTASQKEIPLLSHAIECRINAEDPADNFRPSPGKITKLHFPGGFGVRVESGVQEGAVISPYYDSMVAKIICRGATRKEAIRCMKRALEETVIEGIKTNLKFQLSLLSTDAFQSGEYDTGFLKTWSVQLEGGRGD